jgi:DNA-binding HxlR family transcriptional regulator
MTIAEKYNCKSEHDCIKDMKYLQDTLYVISGKWKMLIIVSLCNGYCHFREIANSVPGITFKVLSKELKDMEENKLITRKVCSEKPVRVEYEITEYSKTLWPMMVEMINWAKHHRKIISR